MVFPKTHETVANIVTVNFDQYNLMSMNYLIGFLTACSRLFHWCHSGPYCVRWTRDYIRGNPPPRAACKLTSQLERKLAWAGPELKDDSMSYTCGSLFKNDLLYTRVVVFFVWILCPVCFGEKWTQRANDRFVCNGLISEMMYDWPRWRIIFVDIDNFYVRWLFSPPYHKFLWRKSFYD